MMMTQVANHSKRNHTDGYFSGKQQQQQQQAGAATATSSGSEEFGRMGSKKPRSASPRGSGGPISPREKKDKVGERVAALQQLVSPFGKTDTASVLQEASGYIKFLHQQLEVLSSPYMRPPPAPGAEPEDPEHYSLRNRGLCLVPVEQTLQLTQSNGADLWAPANTSRRT
ncbi:transcription factor bHLH153-like [Triticum dicoccoides]|uniref:transcription factor bHLH153-like n=1 Tax=Triticum dicoccoides TaxID=85692 RepID=UPI000E7AA1BD|nr:transcription factor bHLH153-like [Triticum dicoccoides]XP_037478285.1 transcription factor bHLH153-like [Triticum dicoccoides]